MGERRGRRRRDAQSADETIAALLSPPRKSVRPARTPDERLATIASTVQQATERRRDHLTRARRTLEHTFADAIAAENPAAEGLRLALIGNRRARLHK